MSDSVLLICPFPNRRCTYMCCIEEKDSQALFKVKVEEKGYDDLILTGPTPKGNL